ncbi:MULTISPECIES: hypothetical protein [Bacillus cereus group]|nr:MULTISPECIES: hypothetical protein [Bacillus cereus group]MCR6789889.1 hypothetical protein [Bacillus thuringiensis]MCR6825869.1 hypothetical protein [Bacillus thuringiensis]MCR6831721.1 hypothetical protein [Bacillus thuringiensis]MEB9328183.1 hypothetical protein [Bacillus cereus]MEB9913761.1 hypothetical protein [Bacillus cereus]
MKRFNHSVIMKKIMGVTLASAIGLSGFGTSVHAAEYTNNVTINQMV